MKSCKTFISVLLIILLAASCGKPDSGRDEPFPTTPEVFTPENSPEASPFITPVSTPAPTLSDPPTGTSPPETTTPVANTTPPVTDNITSTLPNVNLGVITPGIFERRVPRNVPDYVANARSIVEEKHGNIYIGMADLKDPRGYRHIDDGIIHPASTIKSMIMEYALLQAAAGKVNLSEDMDGRTLERRIELMIQISCNESTGYVIARFGRAVINDWLIENYAHTRLNSDYRGNNHGYSATSVYDTIAFMERVFQNRDSEPYKTMFNIMLGTTWSRDKIPAATVGNQNVIVANKTGSFTYGENLAADHDMAIVTEVTSSGEIISAYALTFYTFSRAADANYSVARPAIISMSRDIFEQVSNFERSRR